MGDGGSGRETAGGGRFLECALWRQTLAAKQGRDPHRRERAQLRNAYLDLRERVAPLLAGLSSAMPEPRRCDIAQVDALWESASLACDRTAELNPAETYVLGCAFVFHVAAMRLVASPGRVEELVGADRWCDLVAHRLSDTSGQWPDAPQLEDPSAQICQACAIDVGRQLQPEQAVLLVEQQWRAITFDAGRGLIEEANLQQAYGRLVARLAWSHWWDVDRLPCEFPHIQGSPPWLPLGWSVDPLKLACVLRVADATQLSGGWVPSFLAVLGDTRGTSPWGFHEHMARPQLEDGQLIYTMLHPFDRASAPAWWSALEYLQQVHEQLRRIDVLLDTHGRARLATRGIANVDTPERFATVFPVHGWLPIDANVRIPDVRRHIANLTDGLWEHPTPEVALRALLQNGQDAVVARQVLEPAFHDGEISISLEHRDDGWFLEVRDNGVGMSEDIILDGLLTFGRSGWRLSTTRATFARLTTSGFRPAGTSGVGFYTVFVLADEVMVTSRRYDLGHDSTRRLIFTDGLHTRPLLCTLEPDETPASHGTAVRMRLKTDPTEPGGLLTTSTSVELTPLIERLMPQRQVLITINEHQATQPRRLAASRLELPSAASTPDLDPDRP